jgi:uncharacterized protein (DUF1499 family)
MNKPTRSANFGWYASIASIALLALGPIVNHLEFAPVFTGLIMLNIAVLLSLIVVVMGAFSLRKSANPANRQRLRTASIFALPALLAVAVIMSGGRGAVMTHDISTDTVNPPIFTAAIAQRGAKSNLLEYTAKKAEDQQKGYPDIKSINSNLDSKAAFAQAINVANKMGWDIYAQDENTGVIEAVASTRWFNFKDDVVIRITANTNGSIIDIRSISRVGRGDMGTNAKRVREFIKQFTST